VGLEPLRVPVNDIITHLVRRGHQDDRVARFAQTSLTAFEHFVQRPTVSKEWYATYDKGVNGSLMLTDMQVQEGRKLLNQMLYGCMSEATADRAIPMLADLSARLQPTQRHGNGLCPVCETLQSWPPLRPLLA
jgi:hypothetical protein